MTRVIISGGGTGGHVFPAIAIANALKAKIKDINILFIGAIGRMEMEKVPAAGYRIEGLNISGFQRRLTLKNLGFPFKLMASLIKARSVISRFRPDVVIGVGGYASGPTLRIAASKNIPCLIQEQNSYPGVTNRLLASKVQKICVAYEGMEKFFPGEKIIITGNPIRQDLLNLAGKENEARTYFGIKEKTKVVLVLGGSLGAATINQAMLKFVRESSEVNQTKIQLLWQTGKFYFESICKEMLDAGCWMLDKVSNSEVSESLQSPLIQKWDFVICHPSPDIQHPVSSIQHLVLLPFIDRMDLAYSVSDLIISRAGAIAISELCVVAKPTILIPSPNVAEDHQTKNALALVGQKAALMIRDQEAIEKLGTMITRVMENQALQISLKMHMAPLGIPDAAEKIADEAVKLIPRFSLNDPVSGIQYPVSDNKNQPS
ncbi:MAG: UDP-N-acetylglucosamine--N-acetylmuramyl-(pentapeptide) pyrophosphoryl-undecaprenol N-acetylglucosamine transferase [Bacteroidales bacterium]|jgi:UDP-N-acetylglucosamine--N-acetylmuramyl-(pentapeptide) pyrophosphoryl-undecaprenol N-acetylglucosamine transferase|nr:UDP-N-acetylglucosamine--N-acetylmuramyl-(pentapeptide) pyrophosphoryl-undecaprenol N-acetylglucosamine transferase [Bacteroidales bacterium]